MAWQILDFLPKRILRFRALESQGKRMCARLCETVLEAKEFESQQPQSCFKRWAEGRSITAIARTKTGMNFEEVS